MTPSSIITDYADAGLTYVIKAIVFVSYPSPVIFGDLVISKWAAAWVSAVSGVAAKGQCILPFQVGGAWCLIVSSVGTQ